MLVLYKHFLYITYLKIVNKYREITDRYHYNLEA